MQDRYYDDMGDFGKLGLLRISEDAKLSCFNLEKNV